MVSKHFVRSEEESRPGSKDLSISSLERTFQKMDFRSFAQNLHFEPIRRQERLFRAPPRSDRTGFEFGLEFRRSDDLLERRFVDRA